MSSNNTLPDINWQLTYRKIGMEREYEQALNTLVVRAENPQLWIVPMVQGVTCNKVVTAYRRDEVQVDPYANDLDAGMSHDRCLSKGSYLIGFRRTVEADEKNKGKSANILAGENHKGITLPERLVLGYGYYVTTSQHLDIENWTLCSGSRFRDGSVPDVRWRSGSRRVDVHWCGLYSAHDDLRSRSVVSRPRSSYAA